MKIKVISFGVPWVMDRLHEVEKFWSPVSFEWTPVFTEESAIEMQAWSEGLAVLDQPVLNRWKDKDYDLTLFCMPWRIQPRDYSGRVLENRATVRGLYPANDKAMEVFANEHDHSYVNGFDLGDTFTLYVNHELSHHFYQTMLKIPDRTHELFYSGNPDIARNEIVNELV